MKITTHNIWLAGLILLSWIKAMIQVTFRNPSTYLPVVPEKHETDQDVTRKQWILIRKATRGINTISPVFAKRRKCLIEALTLYYFLTRFDIPGQLHFGVKKTKNTLSTHAWLEINGKILIGGPIEEYHKFTRTH